MPNTDPDQGSSDIPEDIDDFEDLIELGGQLTPGVGTVLRVYRFLKRRISREYIEEIKKLRKEKEIVLRNMEDQAALTQVVREHVAYLRMQVEETEGKLAECMASRPK